MPPTRVLVADMPRLQRELVTELLRPDFEVDVAVPDSSSDTIREAAAARGTHVVILGRDDPPTARALLEALPRLVVLSVADSEFVSWRYGLAPYRERLGKVSPAALTAVIRAREPSPPWWTD